MIVAIDGPAGSGKSSTAAAVARRLGYHHLESGALYRAVTWAALEAGLDESAWVGLDHAAIDAFGIESSLAGDRLEVRAHGVDITDAIRRPRINAHVSPMARVEAVRDWVNERLRSIASSADVVADGRDIGTVVFPLADLKIFLTASPETRARRRLRQQGLAEPDLAQTDAELRRLRSRDAMDSSRSIAPLRRAEDAIVLDTTSLAFEQQVSRIVALAQEIRQGAEEGVARSERSDGGGGDS